MSEDPATTPTIDVVPPNANVSPAITSKPALDRRYVTAALMLVMVLASMEQTVTSTAMPTIIGDLHGLEHYAWVASIYLLACTVTMPLYGRLADAMGRKRVILAAIAIFLAGSLLSATAHSMMALIFFRGLQGLGAGGVMPVVLTIISDLFTLKERARLQGYLSGVWGVSALAGPALGAFLVNTLGWRAIFFVNLPFGLLGMIVLMWKYHPHEKPHATDLDLPGVISLAAGCTTLLVLVSRIGPGGWGAPMAMGLLAAAIVAIGYFIFHERRAPHPIMPAKLMFGRAIGPSIAGSCLFGAAFLSLDTYVPLYVQGGRGGGATAAAGVVTPVILTWAISGFVAASLIMRWGFRKTAVLGTLFVVVGFSGLLACAIFQAPHWMLTAILSITGLGFGPISMGYMLAAQEAVPWQQRGGVTSSVAFFRTMGGAVGIGVLGALFNVLVASDLSKLSQQGISPATLLDPQLRDQLPPDLLRSAQGTIVGALIWVFAAMLALAALQIVVSLLMRPGKCDHPVRKTEALEALA